MRGGSFMSYMSIRQAAQQALALVGGATESVFPTIEALLLGGDDYFVALHYIGHHKVMERYESVLDFLFCELNPEHKFACFAFYNTNGKQLRNLLDADEISEYTGQMLVALDRAVELYREHRRESWKSYVEDVHEQVYDKKFSLAS